jgi:hypothetical protein
MREFKGMWISLEIIYCNDLNPTEKLILSIIDNFTKNNSYCFASNEYFSDVLDMSSGRIANIMTDLKRKNVIQITYLQKGFRNLSINYDFIRENARSQKDVSKALHEFIINHEKVNDVHENVILDNEKVKVNHENVIQNHENVNDNHEFVNDDSRKREHIIKYIKKNDNKVNNKERKNELSFIYPDSFSHVLIDKLNEFFIYRKEIKKPFKNQLSIDRFIQKIEKDIKEYSENIILESIDKSIANQWQGIFIDKSITNNQKQSNHELLTKKDRDYQRIRQEALEMVKSKFI